MFTLRKMCFLALSLIVGLAVATSGCNCDDGGTQGLLGAFATDLPNNRLIFTNAEVNKEVEREFTLFNDGNVEVNISTITIVDDKNKVYTLVSPPADVTLQPGKDAGVKIKVKFLAKESGTFSGRIAVNSPNADNVDAQGNFYVDLRNQLLTPDVRFACGRTLDFGSVDKGKTKTMTCEITNAGTANLVINGYKYVPEKGSKGDFKWDAPEKLPATVEPGGKTKLEIKITYAPSDYPPAEDQGVFELDTNAAVPQKLRVVGTTAVPLVELVPMYGACKADGECKNIDRRLSCTKDAASGQDLCLPRGDTTPFLVFPLTSKGKVTKRTFVIRNTGERPLKIDEIKLDGTSSNDFRVLTTGVQIPLTLQPKQEKEITVEYAPSDAVEDSGKVVVTSNAGNKAQATILLEAASRGCNLEVNPRSHTFRAPKPPLTVNLINAGNESCTLKKVSLKSAGGTTAFALLPTPAPNQTIVPNGRIDFLVNFNPPDANQSYKDVVVIESSDPDEPTIEIELTGKVEGSRECELEATPRRLVYGLVGVGRSKKLSVGLTNKGWGTCNIKSLNVTGTKPAGNNAFQLASRVQPPIKIDSGSNIRLEVAYTPPQEQPGYEGRLTIESNDTQNPTYNVDLTGSSGTLCLEIVPSSMDFGSSKFGCSTPTRKIQVFNLGAAKCQKSISVTKIGLAQGTTSEFRIMSAPPVPKTINAGENIEIGMSYKPKTVGVDTGTLDIENNVQGQSPVTVPLVGEGVSTDDQKDVFKQLQRPLVDIMFVVDDSCSMGDDQNSLAKNFQSFINWAVRLNVDYQIMVTTTDTTGRRAGSGCARGNPKIVTPQTPNPIATFQTNVRVGSSGSGIEKGLEAAYRGLIPPASTGCNKGFYRQAASMSMIFVSDETDQSPQQVQFYISFFKSLKGFRNLDLMRASVVVGPPPSGCRGSGGGAGFAQGAPRYWQVAKELKGVQESICSQNWSATLSNIGSITFGYRTQFFLSRQADPKTLKVKVNGTTVKEDPQDGWQYDATNNSVNFTKSQIPPPGATVQIEYKAICLP